MSQDAAADAVVSWRPGARQVFDEPAAFGRNDSRGLAPGFGPLEPEGSWPRERMARLTAEKYSQEAWNLVAQG